jgi:hypothetical protein
MKIRSSLLFGIGVLMVVPLGYFVYDRIEFVRTARQTAGVVEEVTRQNSSCGRKRTRHACTKYEATLRYEVQGAQYRIFVAAGSSRGHDRPISHAYYAIGARDVVAYDPRRPGRAYRDRFWDIWGAPLITFLFQIGTFVASFHEREKNRSYS